MEEFDDDDFSDLYADVEVQASSAIRALHGSQELPSEDVEIFDNATRGERVKGDSFSVNEIAGGNGGSYEHATGAGLTKLPLENGDACDGGRKSEDDLVILLNEADDGNKQNFDDNDDNVIGGTDGNENGGDHNSQRKNLKYDSLNSKKRKVDEVAHQVHKPGKNADADVGNDRELCLSRAIEENQPAFGRNDGGGKVASARNSGHTHADTVPLDLDKYGSVQISDSVEDNHHDVSDCDSDGMLEAIETSDDTNRRNASSRSDKVSTVDESESSQSGRCQHGPGPSCSPSPSTALSDDDIKRGHKHSKNHSSILFGELQEVVPREYHPSTYSKSHALKPSTGNDRYCQRKRGFIRKELNQHKRSNDIPDLKTHLTDERAAYAVDVKRPYNNHISHGTRRAMLNFGPIEKDMHYFNQSERFFTDYGGFFPDYHMEPAYLENQNWNIHPSYGYKAGWCDGHYMTGRQAFNDKRSSKMDYEAVEDDWYHKQRRHVFHGSIEESRKLIPKHCSSAVNTRGTPFSNKGDALPFRRTKRDCLSPLHDDNNDIKGKSRRFMSSSGRQRDYIDHRYDQNIAHDRREKESSRRGKKKCDSPHNSSDNLCYEEAEDDDKIYIKYRPLPFSSHEEPCGPGRGRFQGAARPKSGFSGRNVRCSCREMHIECGHCSTNIATFDTREGLGYHSSENHHVRRRHYQRPMNTYITNESIEDHHGRDHFVRRRYHQQTEVLPSREEFYESRQQDDTISHSEEHSHHFQKNSRNNRPNDRHVFGRVTELTDEREMDIHRFKMIREEDRRNQFDGCLKSIQVDDCVQMRPRYQDSVDSPLVVGKKCNLQPSRRTSEAGDEKYCGKHDPTEWNVNQKPKSLEDLGEFKLEKATLTNQGKVNANPSDKKWQDKFSGNQQDEFLDIEEGEIISERIYDHPMKCVIASEDVVHINDMVLPKAASDNSGIVERLGDQKIQEIMAKMEKRRERFKESITSVWGSEQNSTQLPNLAVETTKGKLERPARKRRWF